MRKGKLRIRGRAKLCLALGLLAGWAGFVAAQGMAVSGKFEVEPTGAASYTVPIAVPPGTAGMTPSLSLSYNSQGRNGIVGMGWSLDGLPSISRCPRTLAQDGVRGSVTYDANDRFCLDGQRLVAISGAYGADGTEYRTEIESFSKIISRGTAGTGPAWFEVRTKAGQRLEFGNTADSRVLAQGKPTARDWMVNKVSDTKGNSFSITYVNDTTNGQVYPSRVDYTANEVAGLAAYNSVRFVYDMGRPDVVPLYHAGSLAKTTVRLANVQTYAGATLVGDYRLAYQLGSTTGRSQLASVTLCDGAGACLPATTFGWQNGTITPTVISNPGGQNGTLAGYRPYLGDFNGDGMTDVMWDASASTTVAKSSGTRVLWTSTGGGSFSINGNFAGQNGTLASYVPLVADFNRDGRTDVWWYQVDSYGASGPTTIWMSTISGSYSVFVGPSAPLTPTTHQPSLADVNGDGRTDIFWAIPSTPQIITTWTTQADGSVSTASQNGCLTFPSWEGCYRYKTVDKTIGGMDFTGDGVTDLMWLGYRWRGLGDGTFGVVAPVISGYSPYVVDINGDGKTDFLWTSGTTRQLWVSRGDGNFDQQGNAGGQDGTLSGYSPHAGDFNGDGLADILWVRADGNGLSTAAYVLWQGKGDGTFSVISNFGGQDGTLTGFAPILGDFNGDGKTDILWDSRTGADSRSTGTRVLWLSDGVAADLMTSVTGGTGASIAITYKSLTDSSVYSKDDAASDPSIDLQGSMHVVSRVDIGNGMGGTLATAYAYAGARADLDGRGFLGFRQMTVTDLQTNVAQTTTYRQDFPFVGLVVREMSKLGAATLSQTTNLYDAAPLGGTRYRVSLTQSQVTKADLDGAVLPTLTSTYQYDTFGNATEIKVAASDGFKKTTTNAYSNDQANWLLGRLTRASVASLTTTPDPPPGPSGPIDAVIISNANNLNLWDRLVAMGAATPGVPGSWVVTIASGVTIGSVSTNLLALDTGVFPSGSMLKIVNNGTITGAGGNGGKGGQWNCVAYGETCLESSNMDPPPAPGAPGGPALRAQVPVTVVNNYRIWGGGGGGGGLDLDGGGGGAGLVAGKGGPNGAWCSHSYSDPVPPSCGDTGSSGSDGTLTNGGAGVQRYGGFASGHGGGPGLAGVRGTCGGWPCGSDGGPPGASVIGNSFITWAVVGDRRGPLN